MTKANRAIILAAGYGHRMRPVTDHTPKALVSVGGTRIIDNQIAALHQAGIQDIYIVVGYQKEQFASLPAQYPGVHLIENPDYHTGNNISSLYYARDYLDACIIMDSDILIHRKNLFQYEYEHSTYCGIWMEDTHTEWIFRHRDFHITEVSKQGGTGWGLLSISFWTQADAKKLRQHIFQVYSQGIRDEYWDEVPLGFHWGDYDLELRPLLGSEITEIDTFQELCALDKSYLERNEMP